MTLLSDYASNAGNAPLSLLLLVLPVLAHFLLALYAQYALVLFSSYFLTYYLLHCYWELLRC